MSLSILLLPLLGGYYFLSRSLKWKYFYKRTERQRLIFDSLLVGFVFICVSYVIWLVGNLLWPVKLQHFVLHSGISIPFFFPSFISFLMSILFTTLFNWVKREEENWYLSEVIRKTGNSLQQDFLRSYFFEDIVMISLKNGKVYVGLVSELHEPHPFGK